MIRLRHIQIPLYSIGGLAGLTCIAAGVAALRTGAVINGAIAFLLAAALAGIAVWRWRVAPRGRDAHAAYRDLEAAIDRAPVGELVDGSTILIASAGRLMPEVRRYETTPANDDLDICDTYTLTWAPPIVLRHTGLDSTDAATVRAAARWIWHTIRTGQTFANAAEMRGLAAQLAAAQAPPPT